MRNEVNKDTMNNLKIELPTPTNSKFNHEFQELGTLMEPIYGRKVWSLFYRAGMTEQKIRKAFEIAQKRNNLTFGYLIGILKKL